jgi:nucleotide-binding universal stress UspA family protein
MCGFRPVRGSLSIGRLERRSRKLRIQPKYSDPCILLCDASCGTTLALGNDDDILAADNVPGPTGIGSLRAREGFTMLPIKTILHATDFSERSDYAFRVACALARDYQARLVVLHALPTPVIGYPEGVIVTQPEEFRAEARASLQRLLPTDPAIPIERLLTDGDPIAAIVQTAKDRNCDLIVMGTHGWTGVTRLLMGSVAEGVLRRAPCPVLTIKMPSAAVERAEAAKTVKELEPAHN